jgi:hypothetical protein
MDRLATLGHEIHTATGRCLARARRRVLVRRWGTSTRVLSFTICLVIWWLLIAGVLVLTMQVPVASAPKAGLIVAPGWTGRINQTGMPVWLMPADRLAYEESQRGFRESDEEAIERAFTGSEWIEVFHRQAVRIVEVDGEAVQVELLEGWNVGRRGWLKPRHVGP